MGHSESPQRHIPQAACRACLKAAGSRRVTFRDSMPAGVHCTTRIKPGGVPRSPPASEGNNRLPPKLTSQNRNEDARLGLYTTNRCDE